MLPRGVSIRELEPHADDRGVFTELFRASWGLDVLPVQWNAVRSEANVLRGVHVHVRHSDYLTVPLGRALVGLHDLRNHSATAGMGTLVELDGSSPSGLTIPPGVAHGFFFPERSVHVYAVSHEWDPDDELGCRWDDPELGICWPCSEPVVSSRDARLWPLAELARIVNAALGTT